MCIVSPKIYKLCLIPLKFCNYFMKIGVFPEICIIIYELSNLQFIFEQMYQYTAPLCLVTMPKKCIAPLKVNQLSIILSNPLSKKEKMAKKMCEKKM